MLVGYVRIMLSEWLKSALSASGIKQVELARLLTDTIGRSVDASAVTKMASGDRRIYADELLAISSICSYPLPLSLSDDERAEVFSPPVHAINVLEYFQFMMVSTEELHKQICYSLLKSGKITHADDIKSIADDVTRSLSAASKASNQSNSSTSRTVRKIQAAVNKRLSEAKGTEFGNGEPPETEN